MVNPPKQQKDRVSKDPVPSKPWVPRSSPVGRARIAQNRFPKHCASQSIRGRRMTTTGYLVTSHHIPPFTTSPSFVPIFYLNTWFEPERSILERTILRFVEAENE